MIPVDKRMHPFENIEVCKEVFPETVPAFHATQSGHLSASRRSTRALRCLGREDQAMSVVSLRIAAHGGSVISGLGLFPESN